MTGRFHDSRRRFRTDRLDGDAYFKTKRAGPNLDRARKSIHARAEPRKAAGCQGSNREETPLIMRALIIGGAGFMRSHVAFHLLAAESITDGATKPSP